MATSGGAAAPARTERGYAPTRFIQSVYSLEAAGGAARRGRRSSHMRRPRRARRSRSLVSKFKDTRLCLVLHTHPIRLSIGRVPTATLRSSASVGAGTERGPRAAAAPAAPPPAARRGRLLHLPAEERISLNIPAVYHCRPQQRVNKKRAEFAARGEIIADRYRQIHIRLGGSAAGAGALRDAVGTFPRARRGPTRSQRPAARAGAAPSDGKPRRETRQLFHYLQLLSRNYDANRRGVRENPPNGHRIEKVIT
ncbi:hypothetical protein EVAR_57367_1 [Eumeta japonica]|uniref:Uncharacterized protein n=1 Tax=Eumeta variegata TaxID=151549 RepID=A0A4C1ZCE7_EUMVA|nr:hypothetical protein EVAR_57367_1 [Eumeta japonica]